MDLITVAQMEGLIRRDPAHRGLLTHEGELGPLCPGHLTEAARDLATRAAHVAIVTGFFVPDADPPAAETDGPPGAAILAAALKSVGIGVTLITDSFCADAVQSAAIAVGLDSTDVLICPASGDNWVEEFFESSLGKSLTHLIAIERVGPCHDEQSLSQTTQLDAASITRFLATVPMADRGRCHNMRGTIIDPSTAPLYELFEHVARSLPLIKTIGIGDGGNEIGMGAISWDDLRRRLPNSIAGSIICRTSTDWTIVAGTSNWGGFALAAATLVLRGEIGLLDHFDEDCHRVILEQMVADGPAVDGITRRAEATVDGLPFYTYIQTWSALVRLAHAARPGL